MWRLFEYLISMCISYCFLSCDCIIDCICSTGGPQWDSFHLSPVYWGMRSFVFLRCQYCVLFLHIDGIRGFRVFLEFVSGLFVVARWCS